VGEGIDPVSVLNELSAPLKWDENVGRSIIGTFGAVPTIFPVGELFVLPAEPLFEPTPTLYPEALYPADPL
jgi:hypothetical protein